MKHVLLIPLFFFLLFLSMPAHAVTIQINSSNIIGDASVYENTPNLNTGTSPNINIQSLSSGSAGYNSRGYLLFNISSIPPNATITSARLYLNLWSTDGPLGGNPYYELYNTTPYNTTGSVFWREGDFQFATCSGSACTLDKNITWANQPNTTGSVLQDNVSVPVSTPGWYSWNITNALISSYSNSLPISMRIKDSSENKTGNPRGQQFSSKQATNPPYIEVTYTTPNNCNTSVLGTYCYPPDLLANGGEQRIIVTTPDYTCENDIYYTCPLGSLCAQITPQVNITTPLVENFTDCSKCSYVFISDIWGVNSVLLWTNCPNNPECNPGPNSACLQGTNPIITTCPGSFVTATDSIPASAYEYTAGCFDPALGWVPIVIDSQGNQTTINNLTLEIFGNTTNLTSPVMNSCPNSTTSCYIVNNSVCVPAVCEPSTAYSGPNAITSLGAGINSDFGTPYATSVISFIASGVLGLFIFIKTKGKKLEAFIVPFFLAMGGFSMPGVEFFPIWIFIVMVVFSGVLIFWKAKGS